MCEMSPEPIYIGPLLTGKGLQHVIMPGRCRNGRGEMAFAATTRVRHTGGGNAVRPRRPWLMTKRIVLVLDLISYVGIKRMSVSPQK